MNSLQQELFKLQDLKYRDFHSKLMPGIDKETIIGIRTPVLRKFVKNIYFCRCDRHYGWCGIQKLF